MDDDDRPDGHRGTPGETPVSAAETLSTRDRDRRRSLARDLGVLALVGAPHAFTLVVTGDVDWPAFAVAAVVVGVVVAGAWRKRSLVRPNDRRTRVALVALTVVGIALVAYYALVGQPPDGRVASVFSGWVVGAVGARVERARSGP